MGSLSAESVEDSNSKETSSSEEMHLTSSHHSLLSSMWNSELRESSL